MTIKKKPSLKKFSVKHKKPVDKKPPAKKKKKTKKRPKQKTKMGRPKFVIDLAIVEKLALLHCTQAEIGAFLGCHPDTLIKDLEFVSIYKKGLENGRMSLRRYQWKNIEAGSVPMQIFIGKQILGQRDLPEDMTVRKQQNPINIIVNLSPKTEEVDKT